MEYMNGEGPSFIPFMQLIRKATNQSPVHLSTREEAWIVKENKLIYSPNGYNSSLQESNLPFHSLKRAIFTITLPCTQVLVVNSAACKLLNYSSDELCSMKLQNLIQDHHKYKLSTITDQYLNDSNQIQNKKERLVELVSKDGDIIPASLFFKKIDSPQRCLAIFEPIDRKTAVLSVDNNGKIINCDEETTSIFQYDSTELLGTDVRLIIPGICLDPDGDNRHEISYKQRLTGRNKSGISFPLCLVISKSHSAQGIWQIVVWAFLNLNGLIIVNREFRISNCNYQFVKLLFGATRESVINQKITKFIPTFCEDLNQLGRNISGQHDNSDSSQRGDSKKLRPGIAKPKSAKNPDLKPFFTSPISHKNCKKIKFGLNGDHSRSLNICDCKRRQDSNENALSVRLSKSDYDIHLGSDSNYYSTDDNKSASGKGIDGGGGGGGGSGGGGGGGGGGGRNDKKNFDSWQLTPRTKQKNGDCFFDHKHLGLREGYFSGYGKHWDGSDINIYYKVKIISFGDKLFYCVWISRDPWEINDASSNMPTTVTASSSAISSSLDDSTTKDSSYNEELTRNSSASLISHNDEILTRGEYSENYTNIEQIGKGAFGYVKMAFRHFDGLLVVTKFIKKHKINVQSWVYDPKWSIKIPLEISLLTNLNHPNIIEVLDVFHNDSFFQLVMKKHGAGMDLFEFIERKPNSDEKLNSYIFRQIISAVLYLDSIGVLHRDIKDENVIINEKFEVKLIDFGSAAFRPPGKMFSVFYGTVEYCSPEVLQGNRYRGPELEIWALGVTLYVLSFGENPFYDVQETIKGKFTIPVPISSYLYDLLHRMLDRDVSSRINISRVSTHPWITQPVDIDNYKFEDVVHCSVAEADPPRYITEFTFDKKYPNDQNLDVDCDRTMASSNSFCSLQTTENTENFDQYDENLQEFGGDFLSEEPVFKSSTPMSASSSKCREDLTKSAGALNRICDGSMSFKVPTCERCNCENFVKKRFSLDINILKRLSGGSKYPESDCSYEQGCPRAHFNDKSELVLINDLEEMKIVPNGNGSKSYAYDSDSYMRSVKKYGNQGRERTTSGETEETNAAHYPEFYDTSDSRSNDDEEPEYFWDAENDKLRNGSDY